MHIEVIEIGSLAMKLQDAANFRRFHVVLPAGLPDAAFAAALAQTGAGELTGSHVFINIDWLKAQVPVKDSAWVQGFDSMVAYARSRGWMNASGTALRAHLELSQ
jgi:hypothetical protein